MAENLKSVALWKAIELEHDRRIERRHVAVPDVARHAGEEDIGVATLECLRQWQLGNAVFLPKIFAQEQTVNPSGVAAHDHVLIVVGKNLRLNEVARTQ